MLPFFALLRRKLLLWKIEELIRKNFSGRIFGEEFEGNNFGWKNFCGRIFGEEFQGQNYCGRILGGVILVEEFLGGISIYLILRLRRCCKFSENFGVKKRGKCCPFLFQCLRAVRPRNKIFGRSIDVIF